MRFTSFIDYVENVPQEERMSHCNIDAPCSFEGKNGNEYTTKRRSQEAAYENLVVFLIRKGILDKSLNGKNLGKGKVSVNHICKHTAGIGNSHGPVCNNHLHVYLGTPKENWYDENETTGKSALENSIDTKNESINKKYNLIKEYINECILEREK